MPSDQPQKNRPGAPAGSAREKSSPRSAELQGGESAPLARLDDSDLSEDTVYQPGTTPQTGKNQTASVNLVGRQLGDFKILRRLGQGGMATVYLAEQVSLKREAAIKVMHSELMSDETHIRRFEREAKAAAGLTHPNIVQVYMTGDFEGTHYIAQEYVRGINLKEYLSDLEINLISQALEQQDWVVARAAESLGMRRTTLVEKMRKYDISKD